MVLMRKRDLRDLAALYTQGRRARREITAKRAQMERRVLGQVVAIVGRRPSSTWGPWILDTWIDGRADRITPATLASEWRMARKFLRWAAIQLGRSDPTEGLRAPAVPRSEPRALDRTQLMATLRACHDTRELAIVLVMVDCGLRRGEVSRMRMEDWSLSARTLRVFGKGGHERTVPVTAAAEAALRSYLATLPRVASGPLIRRRTDGLGISPHGVGDIVRKVLERAEVKRAAWDRIASHSLRHTCASETLEAGADIRTVQEILGHLSLSSTQIYLRRTSIERMRAALERRSIAA